MKFAALREVDELRRTSCPKSIYLDVAETKLQFEPFPRCSVIIGLLENDLLEQAMRHGSRCFQPKAGSSDIRSSPLRGQHSPFFISYTAW